MFLYKHKSEYTLNSTYLDVNYFKGFVLKASKKITYY